MKSCFICVLFILVCLNSKIFAQTIPANFPVLEELVRRNQLVNSKNKFYSFQLRPIISDSSKTVTTQWKRKPSILITPLIVTTRFNSKRPYGWGDYGMIPNPGAQTYLSTGFEFKYKFLNINFRPELVLAQNKGFDTDLKNLSTLQLRNKFFYWNRGDFPERFGDGWVKNLWWGQSKITLQLGSFEAGVSTENIWWGPGQFNALTFSNNAQGFPHLTINTTKPTRTFLGNFETQLIIGRLENSGIDPSQYPELNEEFFTPFSGDWRYLNAFTFSYNPKWIPGLFVGFSRTFQQYNANRGNTFNDWFPVLEAFQKRKFFEDGNTVEYDSDGRDQSLSFFGRLVIPESKSEFYFEFGRRDHAYNLREAILNPEHARAFILGFNQLFDLPVSDKLLQVRGEITQQQESVNRYIRYGGLTAPLGGGQTWHTHNAARGFVQKGQPLGVGIGVGSNVQTFEFALIEDMDKIGIQLERLANNQDFYYKAQLQDTQRKPWVDLSIAFLFDKKWNNLLMSSKLQFIHARNYQWKLASSSSQDFPKGENLTSFLAQTSLIYFWNK